LPAAVNIGVGCPTGVGLDMARNSAKYQKAFYILDWTYGRICAVHLTPRGLRTKGAFENIVGAQVAARELGRRR